MDYTLHQLMVFIKVVQTRSITRASEELHMTQPAVSIQLKNFQNQFDAPLTEIAGRQLYVTDFGKEICEMAERIISDAHAIHEKALSLKGQLRGKLRISSVASGKYLMPYFLSGFINTLEGIDLAMDFADRTRLLEKVRRNELDFALVSVLPKDIRINKEVLFDNRIYLVGKSGDNISKKTLSVNELKTLPMILREEGSEVRYQMDEYFLKVKMEMSRKLEFMTNEAVKEAIIAGLGYSMLPLIGMRNELQNKNLKIIPAAGLPIRNKWHLIWPKGKKLSSVAEAFLNHVRENKEKVVKEYFSWMEGPLKG